MSEASELLTRLLTGEGLAIKSGVEVTKVEVRDGRKVCTFRELATARPQKARRGDLAGRRSAGQRRAAQPGQDRGSWRCEPWHRSRRLPSDPLDADLRDRRRVCSAPLHAFCRARGGRRFSERRPASRRRSTAQGLPGRLRRPGDCRRGDRGEPGPHRAAALSVSGSISPRLIAHRIDGLTDGFAKVVATPAGKIFGMTVVGEQAGMIIQELVLAMERNLDLRNPGRACPDLSHLRRRNPATGQPASGDPA